MKTSWRHELALAHSRRARCGNCEQCGKEIMRGLDADNCAFTVTVNLEEIPIQAEPAHIAAGRRTYDIDQAGRLWRRLERHRAIVPPGYPIHVQHVCERKELW